MAVTAATSGPRPGDIVYDVRFIVRDAGDVFSTGSSPQGELNTGNLFDALEDAIVAGTITLTGLEIWRRT